MSGTSPGPGDPNELLLPLEPLPPPIPPPPVETSPPRETAGERRGNRPPKGLPRAEDWAEEVLRHLLRRQGEVIEPLGSAVDLLTRQLQAEVRRLSESSTRNTEALNKAVEAIDGTVTTLLQRLADRMAEVEATVERQTTALKNTVLEQGRTLTGSTREAAANIGLARHELSLSVTELNRRTFRHGIWLGAGTAILILLAARLWFPFWGMQRPDMEAWARGNRLLQTYEALPADQQQTLLRTLRWERMPGAVQKLGSGSNGRQAGGQ